MSPRQYRITKKPQAKDRGLCQCDTPRTTIRKAIKKAHIDGPSPFQEWLKLRCDRCLLPLARAAVKGRHVHCWHPHSGHPSAMRFNQVAHQLGSGEQPCVCCLCGERKVRQWHTEPVPQHGPHWRVLVKVFEP